MIRFSVAALSLVVLVGISAVAEEAAPLQLPTDTAPSEVAIPCTLDQVLYTAIRNNSTIDIARLDPDIADTAIREAKGAFDPSATAAFAVKEGHTPLSTIETTGSTVPLPTGLGAAADDLVQLDRVLNQLQGLRNSTITAHENDSSLGVQELFTTGTQISLSGGVTGASSDVSNDQYSANLNLGVRQSLLRGFGRRIGTIVIRQAQNQAQQSEQSFLATVLTTMRQAEIAYWDIVLAREILKIREFGVTLAQEQYDRSDALYKVGKGLQADVLAATAELATRKADFSDAKDDVRAKSLTLLQIIKPQGRGPWQCTLVPAEAPEIPGDALSEEASVAAALEHRPELKQAGLEVERRDLDVRKGRNDMLPSLDLVASYGRNGNATSFGGSTDGFGSSRLDNYSVGFEFSTSLTKRAEKARLVRAKLSVEQAGRTLRRTQDSIEAEARQAVIASGKLRQRIDANKIAIDSHKEQLAIEQGRNQVGKTTTLDVLLVQRDLLQAQTDEATSRIGYMESLASLYAAEGTLLDRRGIKVDAETE